MILREKIKALICALSIFCFFENTGPSLAYGSQNGTDPFEHDETYMDDSGTVDNLINTRDGSDTSVNKASSDYKTMSTTEFYITFLHESASVSETNVLDEFTDSTAIIPSSSTFSESSSVLNSRQDAAIVPRDDDTSNDHMSASSADVDHSYGTEKITVVSNNNLPSSAEDYYTSTTRTPSHTTFSRMVDYSLNTADPTGNYNSINVGDVSQEDEEDNSHTTTWHDQITTELISCVEPSSVQNLTFYGESNSVRVTWNSVASDEECILTYNITWYSDKDDYGSSIANSYEFEYTIYNLTSCTYYTISVIAVGENSASGEAIISGNTTESQIPSVNRLVASASEYEIDVRWNAPNDLSCFNNYRVDVTTEGNPIEVLRTAFTTFNFQIFDDLTACTTYTVIVTPVSINGNSGVNATVVAVTANSVPGAVNNLTVPSDGITEDSVYLTWSAPTEDSACFMYYNVDICHGDSCTKIERIYDEFFNATNLGSCSSYTFSVSAVGYADLISDPVNITAETLYVSPGIPQSMNAVGGNFSLEISWEPPLIGVNCVMRYRVILWDTTVTESTTDTNITIYNLSACQTYTVQITPMGPEGQDGRFGMVNGTTNESVTAPPQLGIHEPEVTESTISISWILNRSANECELKTLQTVCNFNSTDGYGIVATDGGSTNNISNTNSTTNVIINVTVEDLSAFSLYECFARTVNIAGASDPSSSVFVTTGEDVPSAPTSLSIFNLTSSWFTLVWDKPTYLAGHLIAHEISFSWERQFLIPSSCNYTNSTEIIIPINDGTAREYAYSNAVPYSKYTVRIRARTNAGWGNRSDDFSFQTEASIPGSLSHIGYLNRLNTINPDMLDTILFWRLPCSLNGEVESFYIYYHGTRNGFMDDSSYHVQNATNITDADREFQINLGELKAEYNYTFHISTRVFGVSVYGPFISYNVIYPAGIPPWPEETYMDALKIDPYKAERSSSTATLLLPLFENTNGNIQYYAVMISQISHSIAAQTRFDILSGSWPNTSTWHEAMSNTDVTTYQATSIRWHPAKTGHSDNFGGVEAVRFTLGDDPSCAELSPSSYCNGPLEPDSWYQIRMRAFTNGGYRDSLAFIAKTKAEFNWGLVTGVVFGILFFGILLTMTLLIRKGVLQTIRSNFLHRSVHNTPGPEPFTKKKFKLHCQELIDHPGKLSNEFQLLQTLSVDLEMSANAAVLQANRKKNRYINILPYDISRVKLDLLNNDPNTDYINASFMPGYSGISEYIACQGPKEETTYDFWRMVYQYNIKVIVMVTQLVEKGKDKCHQYYPNQRENFEYEDMTLRCSTQLDFISYTQRIITLQKGKNRRTITHLHFKEWSDHGVPDDVHLMINFCQLVRKQMIDNRSLAVVHCSAGVGRTGTLIAVDILLQQIKDNKKLDVFGTVYKLRQHRMNMVQTESQYAYIYNCTLEALNNPYPPKLYKPPSGEPIYENIKRKNREITDSNTNLVNSAETLKKISPSHSLDSMEPVCEVILPKRQIYTTQLSTLSQGGLRYSKSTSAINNQLYPTPELVRHGSYEYPIFEPAPDSPSSRRSRDRNSLLEFVRPIRIETRIAQPKFIISNEKTA